jgi:hypothetical protein
MGNVTIPQLPVATGLTGDELVVLSQLGVMKSAAVSAMLGTPIAGLNVVNVTAPVTLVPAQSGKIIVPAEVSGTITLPTSPVPGTNFTILSPQSHSITIACGGTDTILSPDNYMGLGIPSFLIPSGLPNAVELTWVQGYWQMQTSGQVYCAAAARPSAAVNLGQFAYSAAGSDTSFSIPGYPVGLVLKFGRVNVNGFSGSHVTVTYQTPFPNGVVAAFVTVTSTDDTNNVTLWAQQTLPATLQIGVGGTTTANSYAQFLAIGY